jgi:ketosteroid isomerase-like protein
MSQVTVEIARAFWARAAEDFASDRTDVSDNPWLSPEVVYVEDPLWPGSGTYRGPAEIKARFEEYREILGTGDAALREVVDAGDAVVLTVEIRGESVATGLPWGHEWTYVLRFRDDRVSEFRAFLDHGAALRAAGLTE